MRYVSFLTTALTIAKIRTMLLNEERLNVELQRARKEIEDLKGYVLSTESTDRVFGNNETE